MGHTEAEAKKKRQRGYVRTALLASLAITGVVLVAAIAPNALGQQFRGVCEEKTVEALRACKEDAEERAYVFFRTLAASY